jgi:hypothetical protein
MSPRREIQPSTERLADSERVFVSAVKFNVLISDLSLDQLGQVRKAQTDNCESFYG